MVVLEQEINMTVLAVIGFVVLLLASLYLTVITAIILLGTMAYGYIDDLVVWTGLGAIAMWVLTYLLAPFTITISRV